MSRSVSDIRKTQAAHSWGILLGMLGVPVAALFSKIFPRYDAAWEVLLVVCGLIIVRSAVGYVFPGLGAGNKKSEHAASET
jgi:uncharacterized membrane protein YdcZ (DUF606 family)